MVETSTILTFTATRCSMRSMKSFQPPRKVTLLRGCLYVTFSGKENVADPVPFASIATGIEKFDVCRYFLASLHLANEGRVQISKSDDNRMLVTPLL